MQNASEPIVKGLRQDLQRANPFPGFVVLEEMKKRGEEHPPIDVRPICEYRTAVLSLVSAFGLELDDMSAFIQCSYQFEGLTEILDRLNGLNVPFHFVKVAAIFSDKEGWHHLHWDKLTDEFLIGDDILNLTKETLIECVDWSGQVSTLRIFDVRNIQQGVNSQYPVLFGNEGKIDVEDVGSFRSVFSYPFMRFIKDSNTPAPELRYDFFTACDYVPSIEYQEYSAIKDKLFSFDKAGNGTHLVRSSLGFMLAGQAVVSRYNWDAFVETTKHLLSMPDLNAKVLELYANTPKEKIERIRHMAMIHERLAIIGEGFYLRVLAVDKNLTVQRVLVKHSNQFIDDFVVFRRSNIEELSCYLVNDGGQLTKTPVTNFILYMTDVHAADQLETVHEDLVKPLIKEIIA